eukprot:GEMP01031943.1.p1 GENE.GEMP01031943.1~~GEMP01031943.1.p1  ORF type:complete len:271 (+),score=36.09 GEMP01031943.1:277-1089(+)
MTRSTGLAWRLTSLVTLLTLFLHCRAECALPSYAKDITWFADTEHMYVVNYEADWCKKCNEIRPDYIAAAEGFCKKYPKSMVKFIYADVTDVTVFYDFQVQEDIKIPSIWFYLGEKKIQFKDQEVKNRFTAAFSEQSQDWGLRGLPVAPEAPKPGIPSGGDENSGGAHRNKAAASTDGGMPGWAVALLVMFLLCLCMAALAGSALYLFKKKKGPFGDGGAFTKHTNEGDNSGAASPPVYTPQPNPKRAGGNVGARQPRPQPGTTGVRKIK